MGFWQDYWYVIAFYTLVILLIYIFRSKFEFQGKIVALLRTNFGISFMEGVGKKYAKTIRVLGVIGVVVGFIGMIYITGYLFWGVTQLLDPAAAPVLTPILPGVAFPGSPFVLPLFEGLIALFIVILIHESAHGFVAAAHGMKIKSSGLLLLGPIAGAFVEPDEKVLRKKKYLVQHAVFAAGPWSNILSGLLFVGLLFAAAQGFHAVAEPVGFTFSSVAEGSPAAAGELLPNVVYNAIDDTIIDSPQALQETIQAKQAGDFITFVGDEGSYAFALGVHPEEPSKPWVGIEGIEIVFDLQQSHPILFGVFGFVLKLIQLLIILSFGLGLANLIPIGPVDGGRMFQLAMFHFFGEKRGEIIWRKSTVLLFFLILILLFVPMLRSLF